MEKEKRKKLLFFGDLVNKTETRILKKNVCKIYAYGNVKSFIL